MPSMNETIAKGKICPIISGMAIRQTEKEFGPVKEMFAKCQASSCMAWRWVERTAPDGEQRHGYCGLVGEPVHKQ